MSAIFGGSKSKSSGQQTASSTSQQESKNLAYPQIQQTYAPQTQTGVASNDMVGSLLGLNGQPAQMDGFNNYKDSAGYNFILDQGRRNLDAGNAANGTLDSGAAAKELQSFGQNTASTFYNNYLDRLLGLSSQGMQAGGLISGAGNYSNGTSSSQSQGTQSSSSSSKPGMSSLIGQGLSSLASGGLSSLAGGAGGLGASLASGAGSLGIQGAEIGLPSLPNIGGL